MNSYNSSSVVMSPLKISYDLKPKLKKNKNLLLVQIVKVKEKVTNNIRNPINKRCH